jgi:hypothetical protein
MISDGIEADYLAFDSGAVATISVAAEKVAKRTGILFRFLVSR